jgi:hypothetical protein
MKEVNINARIKRNKLDELAGIYYKEDNSIIVQYLNSKNKKALLGIQREDGIYTIVGEEFIYYSTDSEDEGEISHGEFLEILKNNALDIGKRGTFQFVKVNEMDEVWLLDGPTMNALWNTILLLYNNKKNYRCCTKLNLNK